MTDDEHGPEWLLAEAWRQVGRAATPEDRARALSTFRRAIVTARKQAGEGSPELLGRIRQLEAEAGALYAEVSDQHVRKALRGLSSLRMAIESRLEHHAGARRIVVRLATADGTPIANMELDEETAAHFYGVPDEFRGEGFRTVVQMHFHSSSDVRIYQGRKIVWRNSGKPAKRLPRRALGREAPSNGHGTAYP